MGSWVVVAGLVAGSKVRVSGTLVAVVVFSLPVVLLPVGKDGTAEGAAVAAVLE